MSMSKKSLGFFPVCGIVFIVVLGAIALPYLVDFFVPNAEERIAAAASMISAVSGVAAFVLAIRAYERYFDNKLIDENVKAIINVIENFQKLEFVVSGNTFYLFVRFKHKFLINHYDNYNNVGICFTLEAISRLGDFVSSCQSPFLPNIVANALERISPVICDSVKDKADLAVVDIFTKKHQSDMLRFNKRDLSLKEFLEMFEDLHNSIVEWINDHAKNVDINF